MNEYDITEIQYSVLKDIIIKQTDNISGLNRSITGLKDTIEQQNVIIIDLKNIIKDQNIMIIDLKNIIKEQNKKIGGCEGDIGFQADLQPPKNGIFNY